jgi:hypothetical protein
VRLPALQEPACGGPVPWRRDPGCRTFAEPQLAHGLAAEAAERAALVTGQRLSYQAFDTSTGAIEGAARALAGG